MASVDAYPSLCYTAYGFGKTLWAAGEHPAKSFQYLAKASFEIIDEIVDFFQTLDKETLHEYADELVYLYENFSNLSDYQKGKLIGYALGKYGVEIFGGAAILKGVTKYKALKDANRLCNLESLAISRTSREAIAASALKQYSNRSAFFRNTKIHWDRQNKHVPGVNSYDINKNWSILEHRDPTSLLKKHAGSGIPERGSVGIWKKQDGSLQLPTTRGTVHYSKDGAHIVPAKPNIIKE